MTHRSFAAYRRHRQPPYWLLPLFLLIIFYCTPPESESALDLSANAPTDHVRVFLIAPEDGGALGRKVGCSDSAVAVEVVLPKPRPALEGSLEALFSLESRYHGASGLYNPLYASPLEIEAIQREGSEARIRLGGYVELGGDCDGPRMLAQLTETALQFPDVQRVTFFLGNKPLRQLLADRK
ncbi:MAG TPA: hypothetical protein VJ725_01725 [Thermoanaerobaculia bacterium]|nr:hypothetical protein [Thermoanaerobaculia bacterium]